MICERCEQPTKQVSGITLCGDCWAILSSEFTDGEIRLMEKYLTAEGIRGMLGLPEKA